MFTPSTALVPFRSPPSVGPTGSGTEISVNDESALIRSTDHIPTDPTTDRLTALGQQSGHSDVTEYVSYAARELQNGRAPMPQSATVNQSMKRWHSENPRQADEVLNLSTNLLGAAARSRGKDLEVEESHLSTEGESNDFANPETDVALSGGHLVDTPEVANNSVVSYDRNTVSVPSHNWERSLVPIGTPSVVTASGAPTDFETLRHQRLTRYPGHTAASDAGPQIGDGSTQGFRGPQPPRATFTTGPALSQFHSVVGDILGRFKQQMVHESGGFHMTKESPDGNMRTEAGFKSGVTADGSRISCSVTSTSFKGQDPMDIASMVQDMSDAFDTHLGLPRPMHSGIGNTAIPDSSIFSANRAII
ncbi:hypothetical protein IAT40_004131 [Kwoniella sp. CBS 6097]